MLGACFPHLTGILHVLHRDSDALHALSHSSTSAQHQMFKKICGCLQVSLREHEVCQGQAEWVLKILLMQHVHPLGKTCRSR